MQRSASSWRRTLPEAEAAAIYSGLTARAMSEPEVKAASVIQDFQGDSLDINPLVDELRQQVADVQAGTLKRPEAMLVAQAHTLDALFSSLARRSNGNYQAGHLDAAKSISSWHSGRRRRRCEPSRRWQS